MTRAGARFFAADWEASSFLEFFVDLQLRVAEEASSAVGRTLARLADHARFALQITLVRSVDSFVAYLAEMTGEVANARHATTWSRTLINETWPEWSEKTAPNGSLTSSQKVPADLTAKYSVMLVHGNVLQLAREFETATETPLFISDDEFERFSRLLTLRNLIIHGRTFASDELAHIVDETTSIGGLGVNLGSLREDLKCLRVVVVRIDQVAATRWGIARPVNSSQLFDAIGAASKAAQAHAGSSASDAARVLPDSIA